VSAVSNVHQMKLTTDFPEMGDGPLAIGPYIEPEYFEREKRKIFSRAWINMGRVADLIPKPGDFVVRDIEVLGLTILMVHGRDGMVRGFHNVCPHRGNALAITESGNARSIVCTFHGWSYNLDGTLRNVPGEEAFPNLDKACYGLRTISTDVWNGFIFVNAQEKPDQPLKEFLGGLGKDLEDFPFDRFNHIARYTARVGVNWKSFIDAFHEAYHLVMVHARSFPGMAPKAEVWMPTSARAHGPHHSVSVWADPAHKPTPAETLAWKYGMAFTPGGGDSLPGLNPSGDQNWWFDINTFFPNFFIDVGAGWYFTYNFSPVSVDETDWEMNIYQLDAKDAGQKIAQEYTKVLLRDVLYEDLSTMERLHKALRTGALKTILPGKFEVAVRHQNWIVDQWVNA
jgi:phenylpropionate dioxygenase-like ring-hydroxylating dioxygenase large terminal subunit